MEKILINVNDANNSVYDMLYFGKALKISDKKTVLIGLIDASGSMSGCWPTLTEEWNLIVKKHFDYIYTIIFSTNSTIIEEKYLNRSHLGGGTSICTGFNKLHELLMKLSETEKDFTIIFISDGEDGDMKNISERIQKLPKPAIGININLICIGVGSGFPTFVGMELREKYHVGLSSIPAVFLVSDYKTDFALNFTTIDNNYIQQLQKLSVNPAVKMFPWSDAYESEIFETACFLTEYPKVEINKLEVLTKKSSQLKKSEMEDIFKLWTQEIQLASLKGNIRKQAGIAVEFMEYIYNQYNNSELLESNQEVKKTLTVMERLELKEKKSGTHLLQSLIAECKKMRDGVSLKDLTAEEAAKRLAIGTQQGKYHNKALNMRGINQSDFESFKDIFIKQIDGIKLNSETAQEPSFILLQTQKEIFMENTLCEAFKKCRNAYELVEVFPMVGHTLFIRRTDASMINPYNIQVLSIPRINKVCDTVSLISQGNEMEISIGNDEEEKFNAILPLFDSKADGDMRQLLRTKLFNLIMTFNVMKNVDTFFPDAYAGLLANTFIRLLRYEDSEWKREMIDLIYSTTELVYGGLPFFELSVNMLKDDPKGALVTEHKTEKHKCEDVSKAILNLLILTKRGLINEKTRAEIIKLILIENVGRLYKEGMEPFEYYYGEPTLEEFRHKDSKKNKDKKFNKDDIDKSKTQTANLQNNTTEVINPNVNQNSIVVNINAVDMDQSTDVNVNPIPEDKNENQIVVDSKEEIININSVTILAEDKIKSETLNDIIDKFMRNREHLKFDSIRDLKQNLKKLFVEFNSKNKAENKANIRISNDIFNKPGYRINFSLFYNIHDYFCPNLGEFDARNFWIALNHAMKHRDSHERSINEIEMDYEKIRQSLKKKFIEKQEKELMENIYDGFERPIVSNYLEDYKNSLKMIKDFDCNTELLKTNAKYDSNKSLVNVIFFGPKKSGKSTLAGRLLVDLKGVDQKLFEYYKKAYQTFYPDRENYPYEWLSNTAADERCKDKTIILNVSHINTPNKYINIYDTPGSYKYYKKAIAAMSLVDHYCLCLEANYNQIEKEIPIIKASLVSLAANKCKDLHVVLTKTDYYNLDKDDNKLNNFISEVKNLFDDLLIKSKLKINLNIIPVSSFSGFNISNFVSILDSLKSHEEIYNYDSNESKNYPSKILVLDTIDDKFDGRIVYGQVFGNKLEINSDFVSYPSCKQGKILTCHINYNVVSSSVKPGNQVSIRLSQSAKSLSIEKGSILHLNEKINNKNNQKIKIKDVTVNLKYVGNNTIKVNSCISVEFKYFRETLQVVSIQDSKDKSIDSSKEISADEWIKLRLVPTSNIYFESLWEDNSDSIIIRGPHYKLYGVGKFINITTENF